MTAAVATPPNLFHRFGTLVYVLVALAFAGFASADNNPPLLLLGFVALALSWVLVERPRGRPLPTLVINLGILAAAAVLLGELIFSVQPNLLIALSHFIFAIILCKLFERKSNRDYGLILTLSLLTIVAAAISSTSFAFSCILILYLAVAGYAILIFHLRVEADPGKGTLRPVPLVPSEVPRARSHLRRFALASALFLILCTTIIFLAFPRWRNQDFFTGWSGSGTLQTGFSDRVQFNSGSLQQSDAVVMEVTLLEDGTNIGSATNQPYFRGNTQDAYNTVTRTWEHSDTPPSEIVSDLVPEFPRKNSPPPPQEPDAPAGRPGEAGVTVTLLQPTNPGSLGTITSTFVLRSHPTLTLFTIAPPITFTPQTNMEAAFNPADYSLSAQDPIPAIFTYSITSTMLYHPPKSNVPAFLAIPGDLGLTGSRDRSGLRRNSVSPEIMALAHQLARDILPADRLPTEKDIRPLADLYKNYLEQNYPYNLTFVLKDPRLDFTTDFLLNHKTTGGYCQHFASAMVMLCRSMGLNARMVQGYYGGDFNTVSGTYVVKQKNAHTWVEVFVPGSGWVQYDPTPIGADSTDSFAVSKWFFDVLEIIQRSWLSTVVAFDSTSRLEFFSTVTAWFHQAINYPISVLNEFVLSFWDLFFNTSSANSAARWTGALTLFSMVALAAWLLHTWQRRRTSQLEHILKKVDPRIHKQLAHELHFFDDLLRILAKTGIKKSVLQTPREYVDAISPRLNGSADDARWLVDTFYDIRFGAARATQGLRVRIHSALHRVRQNIHHPHAKKEAPGSQPPC